MRLMWPKPMKATRTIGALSSELNVTYWGIEAKRNKPGMINQSTSAVPISIDSHNSIRSPEI
jgi:hypothetical protein